MRGRATRQDVSGGRDLRPRISLLVTLRHHRECGGGSGGGGGCGDCALRPKECVAARVVVGKTTTFNVASNLTLFQDVCNSYRDL